MTQVEDKIKILQQYEFNLQNFLMQKQQLQNNIAEIDNALNELKNNNEAYQLVGPVLVKKKPSDLITSLNEKKEVLEVRLKAITKQEKAIGEKAEALQKEVIDGMKAEEDKK